MRRLQENPLISRRSIPDSRRELTDVSSVFNPGAIRIGNETRLLLRVQNRGRETYLVRADSTDGINFKIDPTPSQVSGLEALGREIYHVYDPRITQLGDRLLVTLAVDTDRGCFTVVAQTDDLSHLEYVGTMWESEARNGVLFPEQIDGKYVGLVRPNESVAGENVLTGNEIWMVASDDLKAWRPIRRVLAGRPHYWDELIGSGPPPIRTREGWLHIYHGVATHFQSVNIYQAGVCLLNLRDPSIVIARGRYNILEPRADYELTGQVPNVVFPTGLTIDEMDDDGFATPTSRVTLYYGAADTVVAGATTTVHELFDHCYAENE